MERVKYYNIRYSIHYKSGKKWTTETQISALSEYGAIQELKWLKSPLEISIIEIQMVGFGNYVQRDEKTLGYF